jgi:hypothetical protein
MINRVGQAWACLWSRPPAIAHEVYLVELVLESSEIYGGSMHVTLNLETLKKRSLLESDAVPWERLPGAKHWHRIL